MYFNQDNYKAEKVFSPSLYFDLIEVTYIETSEKRLYQRFVTGEIKENNSASIVPYAIKEIINELYVCFD